MHKYERGKVLGKGSFGRAVLAKNRADGKHVVIKEVSMRNMKPAEREAAKQEAELLKVLQHPNIVSCHESFIEGTTLCIVMDYCSEGDLHVALQERRGAALTEAAILDYFVQICLALKHLHDKHILHRDVKTQNVFLARNGIVKLGDLGVSKVLDSTTALAATGVGTPYYLSPEICHGRRYDSKTDVWSAGCVLYELVCLRRPFEGPDMRTLINKIIRGTYLPAPTRYSSELRAVIDGMLRREPAQRLSINQVLRRPVIQARIRKFLSESGLQHESGAGAAPAVPRPLPSPGGPAAEVAAPRRSDAGAAARPPLNPLEGGANQGPRGGAADGARHVAARAPTLEEHAEAAQRARRLAARRRALQQERLQKERERAQEEQERQCMLREEQRRQSREAAQAMREEFASRQAQAMRNKAAAEADRGHVAIYMPPRPRPQPVPHPPVAPLGAPEAQRDARAAWDARGPSGCGGGARRSAEGAPGRVSGAGARAARRWTEEEQPVGGRGLGGELSPEQRRAVFLENKRAARRNRQALLAEAGAGALAAFVGVDDAAPAQCGGGGGAAAGAAAAVQARAAEWVPRYSSGGEADAAGAPGGAQDSLRWAPQSTVNWPTQDGAMEPWIAPMAAPAREERRWDGPQCMRDNGDAELRGVHEAMAAGSALERQPGRARRWDEPRSMRDLGDQGLADLHEATAAGSALNVFRAPLGAGRCEQPAVADRRPLPKVGAVGAEAVEPPARPQRRSWAGDGAAAAGLSYHLARHELIGEDSPDAAAGVGGAPASAAAPQNVRDSGIQDGDRSAAPWPQEAEVNLAGWQPSAERQAGAAAAEAGMCGSVAAGCGWGMAAEPAVGGGTARLLTAGTGVCDAVSRPLTAGGGTAANAAPAPGPQPAREAEPAEVAARVAAGGAAATDGAAGTGADVADAGRANSEEIRGEASVSGMAGSKADSPAIEGSAASGDPAGQGQHSSSSSTDDKVEGDQRGPAKGEAHAVEGDLEGGDTPSVEKAEPQELGPPDVGQPNAAGAASMEHGAPQQAGGRAGNTDKCEPRQHETDSGQQSDSGRPSDSGGRQSDRRSSGGMWAYEAMMRDMAAALRDPDSSDSSLGGSSGSEPVAVGGGAGRAAVEGEAVRELRGRVSEGQFMMDGQAVDLPVGGSASVAQRVEALRVLLETALSTDTFLTVYRHMEQLHDGEDSAVAAERLCDLVGAGQEPYLQLVQQLILSEEVMHAEAADGACTGPRVDVRRGFMRP
eukprot:jgi/Ulvmu1/2241/UM013_0088.1